MKRTVLVTGVSSGIGRAVALKLLQDGHVVAGVSRKVADESFDHPNFQGFRIDLADLDSLPDRISQLLERIDGIDSAVLCAGIGRFGSLEEFSFDQIRRLVELNFTSQAFIARALLPRFKRERSGDMIFIGSEAALRGSRKGTIYCASKFALRGFTQALRDECGKSGVRVTLINPGMVRTNFYDDLDFTHGELPEHAIESEDVAELVAAIFSLRPQTVVDEINLTPFTRVVRFKN